LNFCEYWQQCKRHYFRHGGSKRKGYRQRGARARRGVGWDMPLEAENFVEIAVEKLKAKLMANVPKKIL